MDFSLSDEQLQLRDAVQRFCEHEYPAASRGVPDAPARMDERWRLMADMGLLGLPFSAGHGGSELSAVDVMIVMEGLGRALACEPYCSTVVLAGGLVAAAGTPAQADALLPAVVRGERRLAIALDEPGARYDPLPLAAKAMRDGDGYRLDGRKTLVFDGDAADTLIVAARTSGAPGDRDGVTLFLVDATARGVDLHAYPTLDGRRAADFRFTDVRVPADRVLGEAGGGLALVEAALDRGIAALCAEAVGALDALLELTVDYVKVRKQFGVALASFQALQHRLVDMLIACEQARAMAGVAAMAVDGGDAAERARLVSAAKVQVGNAARLVTREAIQMHGAMGMTDECKVGHYAKRLLVIGQSFGDVRHHLRRFGQEALA
ncbi:acyl-CoA dehydrogenase family protein [Aromatoleum toluclasticum]|uniref:acyl-CoA dehydrogenase family protein n=1 Tax=Aromatoleum toluclasticum TaxID=92003 RepID=UPI000363CFB7|nr:acyl-CoA dehydrogenase [Aromatoleum toluclasticum]